MAGKRELESKLNLALEHLLGNARELLEVSKSSLSGEELEDLQVRQEELLQDVIDADRAFQESWGKEEPEPLASIQRKLKHFQELNEAFVKNLSIRQGIINMELSQIQSSRKQLSDMSSVYSKPVKEKGQGSSRLDTSG